MTTPWIRTLAALAATVLLAAGCSGDDDGDVTETTDGDARIVEHAYGETTVEGTPERVVSLGLTDADPLLALGVEPVAIRPGYGVDGVGPWAREALGDASPEVLDAEEINVEQVAALDPDLIVAISADVDEATYDKLSKLAPTIVRPEGAINYGVSWEVATTMIGSAVDKADEAQTIIEDTKVAINDTLRANPHIDGTNGAIVRANPEGGWYIYTPVDARGQFMFELGVNLPPKLAKLDDGSSYWVDVSAEKTDDLEADVLVAIGDKDEQKLFKGNKLFQDLAVSRRGGVVYVPPEPLGQALSYTTVLSIPYALDALAPQISEALD
ncbi:iron-siderophore ABC transporter substrate-binding protein [Solicola gregarius]|uniref:Iron-siderophore ABC transporter substrate-binding protein n=1 Tax=Solicola gregarius TaxID=2908642 RepID=A0AA46YK99_9ACTN|nr:iron-siderophore ABC transporter substrate-binding protein [Solicola gregarius]UYM04349.1 iron-siderophore ABC transporter substrate-binding protein [Solicola gregarius]